MLCVGFVGVIRLDGEMRSQRSDLADMECVGLAQIGVAAE